MRVRYSAGFPFDIIALWISRKIVPRTHRDLTVDVRTATRSTYNILYYFIFFLSLSLVRVFDRLQIAQTVLLTLALNIFLRRIV